MKKLVSILFLVLFSFCSKKKESNLPRIIVPEVDNVVEVNSNRMLQISPNIANYLPTNFSKDSSLRSKLQSEEYEKYTVFVTNRDTILPKYDFKIIVDTSYTIPIKGYEYVSYDLPNKKYDIVNGLINGIEPTGNQIKKSIKEVNKYTNKTFKSWKDNVCCFPLLFYNNENQPSIVKKIKYIQQALDADGIWKPIEFYRKSESCFVNYYFFKSLPKKYQAYSIIKYHGNFKTKLRVKVQINNYYYYSNEFIGYINKSQFDNKYAQDYLEFWDSYGIENDKSIFLENDL